MSVHDEVSPAVPSLDDVQNFLSRAKHSLRLGSRWLMALPPYARDPDLEDHFLTVAQPAPLREMYGMFLDEASHLDNRETIRLYENRNHFGPELASAIAIARDAAKSMGFHVYAGPPGIDRTKDALDKLERAVAVLGDALADVRPVPAAVINSNQASDLLNPRARRGRIRGVCKWQEALAELKSRMASNLPHTILDLAKAVSCHKDTLSNNPRFMRNYNELIKAMARVRPIRGTKTNGRMEAWVDPRDDRDRDGGDN
jgi:hypothetical protein